MVNYDNKNWMKLLFTFKGSVIKEITPKVLFFTLYSVVIILISEYVIKIDIPSPALAIVGGALGFMLVFRTNTSYDRYWEGRKLWGELVNQTRNIAIKVENYCLNNSEAGNEIMKLQMAFLHTLKIAIRDEKDFSSVEKYVGKEKIEKITKYSRPYMVIIALIAAEILKLKNKKIIDETQYLLLSQNLDYVTNAAGGIERIRRTPLPIAYTLHLKRVLYIFCLILPFGFKEGFGWGAVPIVTFISYVFLGIEEIGVEIEDPFGEDANDLPIDEMCEALEKNIEEIENIIKN